MLKADFHTHSSEDPADLIPYSAVRLIDSAAQLGYQIVAITLHDKQLDVGDLSKYARDLGVTVIRGIERTIAGKHVLLLNFPQAVDSVRTFDDVRRLKARTSGLVIAPHPFFPAPTCLGRELDRHADLFDAVEVNGFYTPEIDFNRRARQWAAAHGKPLVGNGDIHRLKQLDRTYSLIDAVPDPDAICDAIRAGRVEIRTHPISLSQAAMHFSSLLAADFRKRIFLRNQRYPVPARSLHDRACRAVPDTGTI